MKKKIIIKKEPYVEKEKKIAPVSDFIKLLLSNNKVLRQLLAIGASSLFRHRHQIMPYVRSDFYPAHSPQGKARTLKKAHLRWGPYFIITQVIQIIAQASKLLL